MKLINHYLRDK